MAELFMAFLLASAVGSALAIILTLLRPITKKYFSGSWHFYIWLVVLLVMIFPIKLNLPEKSIITQNAETISTTLKEETPIIVQEETQPITIQPTQPEEKVSFMQQTKAYINDFVLQFDYIWLFGALLLQLLRLLNYMIFLIKVHKHTKIISCQEVLQYTKRKIVTRTSEKISSPLMIGIFRPTLLLPQTALTQEQLHNILFHEMTHLNRNDLLYKWFVGFVKCLCWYNPMIYLIGRQINIDCEISCDLVVVEKMNEEEKKSYMETILSLLTYKNSRTVPLTTGMASNKKILKKRFYMINKKMKISKRVAVLSGVTAVMILITAFSVSGVLNGSVFKAYNISAPEPNIEKTTENNFNLPLNLLDDNNRKNISNPVQDNETANTVNNDITFEQIPETAKNVRTDANNNAAEIKPYKNNIPANSSAVQKTPTRIKSSEVSSELYGGFEQVAIENSTTQGIENALIQNGITKSHNNTANLSKNYIMNEYTYEDSLNYNYSGVQCDSNGNISIYFSVNSDSLVDIQFYDTETKEDVGQYGILANNENAYTFIGFDPNKTYDISIQGKTQDTWKIEGKHIIY